MLCIAIEGEKRCWPAFANSFENEFKTWKRNEMAGAVFELCENKNHPFSDGVANSTGKMDSSHIVD